MKKPTRKTATSSAQTRDRRAERLARELAEARADRDLAQKRRDELEAELGALRGEVDPAYLLALHKLASEARTALTDIDLDVDRYPLALAISSPGERTDVAAMCREVERKDRDLHVLCRTGLSSLRHLERELMMVIFSVQHPKRAAEVRAMHREAHGG